MEGFLAEIQNVQLLKQILPLVFKAKYIGKVFKDAPTYFNFYPSSLMSALIEPYYH